MKAHSARVRNTAAAILAVMVMATGACSDQVDGSGCPEGTTEREAINDLAGPGAPTREDAVRAELQNLGMDATDDAVTAGVVAAGPGGNAGTELVTVETENGTEVTMTLAPLDPGWAAESSSWCAPDDG